MRFVDSHVHASDYHRTHEILRSSLEAGTLLVACGVDETSSSKTLEISKSNPGSVFAFVGLHPSETRTTTGIEWLRKMVISASGVGEIGLDPKYSEAGAASTQMAMFREQLALAETERKPVQVHSRNAEGLCLEELGTHNLTSVLLHWFNGEQELSKAEALGYFVSFGPAIMESRKLQRMASRYSTDLILVESDGPVAFAPLGGAEGPLTVPSVVFKLAELKRVSFEEMAEKTVQNASAYLPALRKVKLPTDSGSNRKIGQDKAPF